MDYKEKLRLAKEALDSGSYDKETIEYIFPELKEFEDERIRTFLHHTFTAQYLCKDKSGTWHREPVVNILAWLEKQGERKIMVTDEQIHWLKWAIRRLPDTEKANEAEAVLTEFVEQLEKQGEQNSPILSNSSNIGKDLQVDGFDAELNALLKKYEHLPKKDLQEPLEFYLGVVKDDLDIVREEKPKWSEEDKNMVDYLIRCCEKEHKELCNDKYGHQEIVSDLKRSCREKWDWLKSIKQRMEEQQ